MKMRRLVVIALVLSMLLAIPVVANAASPAPGGPFATSFRVQNLDTTEANCVYVFYNASGSAEFTSPGTTIQPGDGLNVLTPQISGLANGTYSGVVSCDKKVAAVVNFSDADSGASHNGINTPATVWYAPATYDNYYNFYSNIVAQNTTGSAVDITVEYYAPGALTPVKTESKTGVPAYASVVFEQEGLAELANNVSYSAKISGTGAIATVVNIYGRGEADNQLYSYNPFSSGSRVAYAPVIMNKYYTFDTSMTIQNIGTEKTTVKVTYGTGLEKSYEIDPGNSAALYTPASGVPTGLTSAKIESDKADIVVLVNESNTNGRAASYDGFAAGSTTVSAPTVSHNYYGFTSSVTCQNVGTAPTAVTIKYAGVTTPFTTGSIEPFGKPAEMLQSLASQGLASGYVGSATITADQPIVCIVNQDLIHGPNASNKQDQQYAYNALAN